MTWSRFDDAARKHPKATMAGNEAWGFWCAAIMYCNQYGTDGFVPDSALATDVLPVPIKRARAVALAEKLCTARLREDGDALFARDDARKGYVVNDFLEWNPSKAEVDAKRRLAKERKDRWSDRNANGTHDGTRSAERSERVPERAENANGTVPRVRAPGRVPSRPPVPPVREEEDHPPDATQIRPRDPLLDSLTGKSPKQRPDVLALFERWKTVFRMPEAKLDIGMFNTDADILAECLDAHGPELCNMVCDFAPNDGMVSGRDDEKRQPHPTIAYIFGNQNAFLRILKAAKAAKKTEGISPMEKIRRAGELR